MIEIDDVSHSLGGTTVLDRVTAHLPRGGITALIGPNGAGKSTLLHLAARLLAVKAGSIRIDGHDVSSTPTGTLALRLAILPQATGVPSRLSVRDLVAFGRWPHHHGRPGPGDEVATAEALDRFELLPLADRWLDELSGGQAQRAHVAMAYAQGTPWLLLDEPLAALDPRHARRLMERLHALSRGPAGRSIVIVLHDVNHASAWADHVLALKNGRVHSQGAPEAVLTGPNLSDLYDTRVDVVAVGRRRLVDHHGGPDASAPLAPTELE